MTDYKLTVGLEIHPIRKPAASNGASAYNHEI